MNRCSNITVQCLNGLNINGVWPILEKRRETARQLAQPSLRHAAPTEEGLRRELCCTHLTTQKGQPGGQQENPKRLAARYWQHCPLCPMTRPGSRPRKWKKKCKSHCPAPVHTSHPLLEPQTILRDSQSKNYCTGEENGTRRPRLEPVLLCGEAIPECLQKVRRATSDPQGRQQGAEFSSLGVHSEGDTFLV